MTLYQLFIVERINLKDLAAAIVTDCLWGHVDPLLLITSPGWLNLMLFNIWVPKAV